MKIAVCVPCYNEETSIGKVVSDFRQQLPAAEIYVIDNDSDGDFIGIDSDAGATVLREFGHGKGNVVRSMLRLINADIYGHGR